jgi:fumarate hydratase class II
MRHQPGAGRPDNVSGYTLREVPIGISAKGMRREAYEMGSIDGARTRSVAVRADRYWGASTQLSFRVYPPSADRLPERFHRCYGIAKKAAAFANGQAGRLPAWKAEAVGMAGGRSHRGQAFRPFSAFRLAFRFRPGAIVPHARKDP